MKGKKILVQRFPENPLITPDDVPWVKIYPPPWRSAHNPGVIYDEKEALFKMLFRGGVRIGSMLGYAESKDGRKRWKVSPKPALRFFDNNFWHKHTVAGIEDPRIVKWINGYWYIFATACDFHYHFINPNKGGRLGVWRTKDFKSFEWVAAPFPGTSKNAAILSEPIGAYAYILFRRHPDILIARTIDWTLRTNWQDETKLLSIQDVALSPNGERPNKIGIAGPPILTPKGWLLIYHAKYGRGLGWSACLWYGLGFIVLDLRNPAKIIYNHPQLILWPEKREEIYGRIKAICFSCATIDKGDDQIYVYWGGADTVICGGFLKKEDLPMCY